MEQTTRKMWKNSSVSISYRPVWLVTIIVAVLIKNTMSIGFFFIITEAKINGKGLLNKLPTVFEMLDLSVGFKMDIEERVKEVRNNRHFIHFIIIIEISWRELTVLLQWFLKVVLVCVHMYNNNIALHLLSCILLSFSGWHDNGVQRFIVRAKRWNTEY